MPGRYAVSQWWASLLNGLACTKTSYPKNGFKYHARKVIVARHHQNIQATTQNVDFEFSPDQFLQKEWTYFYDTFSTIWAITELWQRLGSFSRLLVAALVLMEWHVSSFGLSCTQRFLQKLLACVQTKKRSANQYDSQHLIMEQNQSLRFLRLMQAWKEALLRWTVKYPMR
jgi:hypothetical protein